MSHPLMTYPILFVTLFVLCGCEDLVAGRELTMEGKIPIRKAIGGSHRAFRFRSR
jgi:hypothetical protein